MRELRSGFAIAQRRALTKEAKADASLHNSPRNWPACRNGKRNASPL